MISTLTKLIAKGESATLELKRSTGELREALQTLCAFANGKGGRVIIGPEQTLSGLPRLDASALGGSEGARLLGNRAAGMLLAVPAVTEHQLKDELPSTLLLLCLSPAFLRTDPELPALWRELAGRSERRIALSRPTQHQLESAWRRAMLERVHRRPGLLFSKVSSTGHSPGLRRNA